MPASGTVRFEEETSTPVSFDEDALRRRTVKQLARKHKTDNPGCSPSVFLTLLGLVICTVGLIVGVVVFNVQWRRYGVLWGGYLEWNCTLVSCQLSFLDGYSYTGTYRATGFRSFMKRSAKKFANKFAGEKWEPVERWIQDWEGVDKSDTESRLWDEVQDRLPLGLSLSSLRLKDELLPSTFRLSELPEAAKVLVTTKLQRPYRFVIMWNGRTPFLVELWLRGKQKRVRVFPDLEWPDEDEGNWVNWMDRLVLMSND
eukprot:s749_g15.t1